MGTMTGFFRWSHKWVALIVTIYLLFEIVTGIFLQVRKPVDWIQPPTEKGQGLGEYNPTVTHAQILAAAKSVPDAKVDGWGDIILLDMRVKEGIVKVRTKEWYEVQVDTQTGEVLSHNQRWNDIIGGWHSGAGFGKVVLTVFSVLAVLAFFLSVSGTWLGVDTTIRKIKDMSARKKAMAAMKERGIEAPKVKPPFNLVRFCLDYHYYLAIPVFVPYLVVIYSGLALQLRDFQGAYPGAAGGTLATVTGSSATPTLTYKEAVESALAAEEFNVENIKDIWRIYTYPADGVITLRTKRYVGTRAQIDAATGEVLDIGAFTSDFWEDTHQGHFYEVTGDTQRKGWDYNFVLDVFLILHGIALLFWILGTIAVIKLTFFDKKATT